MIGGKPWNWGKAEKPEKPEKPLAAKGSLSISSRRSSTSERLCPNGWLKKGCRWREDLAKGVPAKICSKREKGSLKWKLGNPVRCDIKGSGKVLLLGGHCP